MMPKNHVIRPRRSLATTKARTALPQLVNELVAVKKAGATLAEHAVELGPRNKGGVWLVPTVDVDAAMEREEELRARIDELEDEAENMAIGFFLTQRLQQSSGRTTSGADFIRELGFDDLAADLPD
jgi:hypothetical protein